MARTTIPWGDGSGDNIYLDYPSASGNQTVSVSSDENTGGARSKIVTFSASGVSPVTITVTQEQPRNYLISGNPTISGTILTPANNRGFIYTNTPFSPGNSDFDIITSIRYKSFLSWRDVISTVTQRGDVARCMTVQADQAANPLLHRLYLSTDGSSWVWNVSQNIYIQTGVLNEWRDIRISRENGIYRLYIRARGGNWDSNGNQASGLSVTFGQHISFGGGFSNNAPDGDIDLAETKIYIGGSLWWSAI